MKEFHCVAQVGGDGISSGALTICGKIALYGVDTYLGSFGKWQSVLHLKAPYESNHSYHSLSSYSTQEQDYKRKKKSGLLWDWTHWQR